MNPTAPGVYLIEVPSANRTITGVSTSITAFIGRTLKGPVDSATRISNYGTFEKRFGGLWLDSTVSYAVRQFFQNGGSEAVIVRIANTRGEAGTHVLDNGDPDGIVLMETAPGSNGSFIRVAVTDDGADRHIELTEWIRAVNGSAIDVRAIDISGGDAAALAAALGAEQSLVTVSDETADFANLPNEAAATDLPSGTAPARPATAHLPMAEPGLQIVAAAVGEDGNDLAISVYHSQSSDAHFSLLVEELQDDGSYATRGVVSGVTLANVVAQTAAVAGIGIEVDGDPTDLEARPLAVTRQHLQGGDEATEATLELPTASLPIVAADPGSWGNQLRLRVDHDTADTSDTALFNLTVELLNDNEEVLATEEFRNVSVDPVSARNLTTILAQKSLLVRAPDPLPEVAPVATGAAGIMFFEGHDGGAVAAADFTGPGMQANKQGLYQLADIDLFNMMVIPPLDRATDVPDALWADALAFCRERRAMLLVDPPSAWNRPDQAITGIAGMAGLRDPNSVLYYPRVQAADPLRDNALETFAPSGIVAGLMARTDGQRGVWKAPAGLEAGLVGVRAFSYALIDSEVGQLNPLGINCLQTRPAAGPVAWGARTLVGDDRLASQWKYLPVRRLALMIEESLYRGTQWAVFEPNDTQLWQQLRLSIDNFMNNLFRRGAFQGATPDEAYLVKCDEETTTQNDIDSGIVNIEVGFRPLKPAEFIIIRIRQLAGEAQS